MSIVDILLCVIIVLLIGYCARLRLRQQVKNDDPSPIEGLTLHVSNDDIIQYIRRIADRFSPFMKSKQIDFSIKFAPESMMGWLDTEIINKIIIMLMYEVMENQSSGGRIQLDVHANKNYDHVIVRFNDNAARLPDTCIFIIRYLVLLHHGTIRKEYYEHQGNMIVLEFPIKKSVYQEGLAIQDSPTVEDQPSPFHIPNDVRLNIPTITLPEGYASGTEPLGRLVQQAYESSDQKFLQRAVKCVKEHIDDSDYDRESFAADMGASASTLYNKIRAMTGKNVTAFIRDIRIKTACQLARENPDLRVSDIAYRVGFKDPKYFATTFKKETGMQPKEYLDKLRVKS